jgi:hypothetical protein
MKLIFYCLLLVMPISLISMEADIPDTQALLAERSSLDEVCIQMDDFVKLTAEQAFIETIKTALPAEIWWHIGSLLEADDKALLFILEFLEIDQDQALELVKNYRVKTEENPVQFFDTLVLRKNAEQLERAWCLLKNDRSQLEHYSIANQVDLLKGYLDAQYQRIISNKKEIHYSIHCIDNLEQFIHQTNRRNTLFNCSVVPSPMKLVGFAILGGAAIIAMLIFGNEQPISHYYSDIDKCISDAYLGNYERCAIAAWNILDYPPYPEHYANYTHTQLRDTLLNNCELQSQVYQENERPECLNAHPFPVLEVALVNSLGIITPIAALLWARYCKSRMLISQDIVTVIADYKNKLQAYQTELKETVNQ